MAEPAKPQPGPADPSMEDILASIRRILDDEASTPSPAPPPTDDVMELNETMLAPEDRPARADPPAPPAPAAEAAPSLAETALVGAAAASAAAASLAALRAATGAAAAAPAKPETPIGYAQLTLEQMVREEIRPLLKAWLDENLPPLVERLVKAELERIARG